MEILYRSSNFHQCGGRVPGISNECDEKISAILRPELEKDEKEKVLRIYSSIFQ
jgi:hypothetical protein